MKLTVRHKDIRSSHVVDTFIEERILALEGRLQIDEANVSLEHLGEVSPPFRVHVHLVTPGPDLLAESREHTIRAAIDKAMAQLEHKITSRELKRTRRVKGNLQSPATLRNRRN